MLARETEANECCCWSIIVCKWMRVENGNFSFSFYLRFLCVRKFLPIISAKARLNFFLLIFFLSFRCFSSTPKKDCVLLPFVLNWIKKNISLACVVWVSVMGVEEEREEKKLVNRKKEWKGERETPGRVNVAGGHWIFRYPSKEKQRKESAFLVESERYLPWRRRANEKAARWCETAFQKGGFLMFF